MRVYKSSVHIESHFSVAGEKNFLYLVWCNFKMWPCVWLCFNFWSCECMFGEDHGQSSSICKTKILDLLNIFLDQPFWICQSNRFNLFFNLFFFTVTSDRSSVIQAQWTSRNSQCLHIIFHPCISGDSMIWNEEVLFGVWGVIVVQEKIRAQVQFTKRHVTAKPTSVLQ